MANAAAAEEITTVCTKNRSPPLWCTAPACTGLRECPSELKHELLAHCNTVDGNTVSIYPHRYVPVQSMNAHSAYMYKVCLLRFNIPSNKKASADARLQRYQQHHHNVALTC
eukprot:GHUV01026693.1.p2 GENE.GHUV01026693.1~~GHUV01026693.1.p2  ORF type:complete len:112 (+),score=14.68 GHUV01026693.1:1294-1629(+)